MPYLVSGRLLQRTLAGFGLWCCLLLIPNAVQSSTNHFVTLEWEPNSESDLAGYKVYQGTTAGSYGTTIDVQNVTTHTISNLQASLTYYFALTAYDVNGNESYPSDELNIYVTDSSIDDIDDTPPSVSLTSPTNDANLSGLVTLMATATDNVGVEGVQFLLNGANLGAEDTTNQFSVAWDTTGMDPGQYTLTAIARDAAGNTTSSDPVLVTLASSPAILAVSVEGNGTVTSSPTGIHCSHDTCYASYEVGSTITLTAKPDKRWKFSGWSGPCSGTNECVIQLSTDQYVGATFSKGGNGKGRGGRKK